MPTGQLAGTGSRSASPRTQRKRPGDLTGVRGQQLAAKAAADKAKAAQQVEDALEAEREEKLATEVDYTSETREKQRQAAEKNEVTEIEVEVRPKTERIRVNYPIEEMTFGKEILSDAEYDDNGTMIKAPVLGGLKTYSFEEGRWYTVDAELADHLRFLGYVYE